MAGISMPSSSAPPGTITFGPDAFDAWIGRLEQEGVPVWNPPEVLRWNARKTYLKELEAAGIPTVPTRFIEEEGTSLEADPRRGRLG